MISWGHFAGHPSAAETKKDAMPRQGRIYCILENLFSKGKMWKPQFSSFVSIPRTTHKFFIYHIEILQYVNCTNDA